MGVAERDPIVLYAIDKIMEIEASIAAGASWRADFQAQVDRVSVALFGITAADTVRQEPVRSSGHSDPAFVVAWQSWAAWDAAFYALASDVSWDERCEYFEEIGVDPFDENGHELRCFDLFARQIIVVVNALDERAILTLDGSGKSSGQTAEQWGAALEADARRRQTRRP